MFFCKFSFFRRFVLFAFTGALGACFFNVSLAVEEPDPDEAPTATLSEPLSGEESSWHLLETWQFSMPSESVPGLFDGFWSIQLTAGNLLQDAPIMSPIYEMLLDGGNLRLSSDLAVQTLTQNAGILGINGGQTLEIIESFTWSNGLIHGSSDPFLGEGLLLIGADAQVLMNGPVILGPNMRLHNEGYVSMNSPTLPVIGDDTETSALGIPLAGNPVIFENDGTLEILEGTDIEGEFTLHNLSGGFLLIDGLSGTSTLVTSFLNQGQIDILNGRYLYLKGGGQLGGTINIASNSRLYLERGEYLLDNPIFSSTGEVKIQNDGYLRTVGSSISLPTLYMFNTGALQVSTGDTLELGGSSGSLNGEIELQTGSSLKILGTYTLNSVDFSGSGSFDIVSGRVNTNASTALPSLLISGGHLQLVKSEHILTLSDAVDGFGANHRFFMGSTAGPGKFILNAAAQLEIAEGFIYGDATGTPALDLQGNAYIDADIPSIVLNLSGFGALDGSGEIGLAPGSTWSGGSMRGSGLTVINSDTELVLDFLNFPELSRDLRNEGTFRMVSEGDVYNGINAFEPLVITNNGLFEMTGNLFLEGYEDYANIDPLDPESYQYPQSILDFTNDGTFRLSSPESINLRFDYAGAGSVEVMGGYVNWYGSGAGTGHFSVESGATLNVVGARLAVGSLGGAGEVRISGGELTVAGLIDIGNVSFDSSFQESALILQSVEENHLWGLHSSVDFSPMARLSSAGNIRLTGESTFAGTLDLPQDGLFTVDGAGIQFGELLIADAGANADPSDDPVLNLIAGGSAKFMGNETVIPRLNQQDADLLVSVDKRVIVTHEAHIFTGLIQGFLSSPTEDPPDDFPVTAFIEEEPPLPPDDEPGSTQPVGVFQIAGSAKLYFSGPASLGSDLQIVNDGFVVQVDEGGLFGFGSFTPLGTEPTLSTGAPRILNNGSWTIDSDVGIDGESSLQNFGYFSKVGGLGTSILLTSIENSGTIAAESGILQIIGSFYNSGLMQASGQGQLLLSGIGESTGGTFEAQGPNSSIVFNSESIFLDGGSSIVGEGAVVFESTNVDHYGSLATGSLIVENAYLHLKPGSDAVTDNLALSGGSLILSGRKLQVNSEGFIQGFLNLSEGSQLAFSPPSVEESFILRHGAEILGDGSFDVMGGALRMEFDDQILPEDGPQTAFIDKLSLASTSSLVIDGGTELVVNSSLHWDGAELQGDGTLRLQEFSNTQLKASAYAEASIVNTGLFEIHGDITLSGSGSFANDFYSSTLAKVSGDGTARIEKDVLNNGTIRVHSGTLEFAGQLENFGEINLDNNARLRHSGGSAVRLDEGASLTGHGTLEASFDASQAFGTRIAPGNSIGTLEITGDLVLAGAYFEFEIGGVGFHDQLIVGGDLTLGESAFTLSFSSDFLPETLTRDDVFPLIEVGGLLDASMLGLSSGDRLFFDQDGPHSFKVLINDPSFANQLILTDYQPVPEPSTWILLLLGTAFLIFKIRRHQS